MRKLGLSAAGLAVLLGSMMADRSARACEDRFWQCQGMTSGPAETAKDEVAPQQPPQPDSDQQRKAQARKRQTVLARVKRQFEQFLAERAQRDGPAPTSAQPQEREALFREFMQWRKERPAARRQATEAR